MIKKIKLLALTAVIIFCTSLNTFAAQQPWVNDLRKLFLSNSSVIYVLNIRTFNAKDNDGNGIINFETGEESGNFLNAIERLDELQTMGINTIHVQPVTPVGKTKALGTAGSVYAAASFNSINPQLANPLSSLSVEEQARKFIDEAHKRNIRVMIDMPACGAYDLYLQRPELFVKDKSGQPVVPSDWTDVRLLNAGTEDNINRDVYNLYKGFVDMVISLGADGIRADVAPIKPAKFWKELIAYSRSQDPQFAWLAESSDSWKSPLVAGYAYTPYNKLLDAGFDGYYGSFFNLKNWKNGKELIEHVKFNQNLAKKYPDGKSVIGSFSTHDELSPILINGPAYSEMIMWLSATLPINSYFVDGFQTGDNYIYFWANKKAQKTYTDDEYYFVHRGKIDIFNYSRRPGGLHDELFRDFILANSFKGLISPIIRNGKFTPLKTSKPEIFAYAMSHNKQTVLVFGNLSFKDNCEGRVKVPKLTKDNIAIPIKVNSIPIFENGAYNLKLNPGEIQVFLIQGFEL